jgi:hypothetical protein
MTLLPHFSSFVSLVTLAFAVVRRHQDDDQPPIASTFGVIGLKNHPARSAATALLITMADVPARSLNAASVRFRSSVSIS